MKSTVKRKQNQPFSCTHKYIRDWRERSVTLLASSSCNEQPRVILSDVDPPLISAKEVVFSESSLVPNEFTEAFRPICSHEEAICGPLFSLSKSSMRNFIG